MAMGLCKQRKEAMRLFAKLEVLDKKIDACTVEPEELDQGVVLVKSLVTAYSALAVYLRTDKVKKAKEKRKGRVIMDTYLVGLAIHLGAGDQPGVVVSDRTGVYVCVVKDRNCFSPDIMGEFRGKAISILEITASSPEEAGREYCKHFSLPPYGEEQEEPLEIVVNI